ncbi:hypothetical protein [Terasakiella pusilla]|uniref:hypothetical protein n=2 Tax=Terasakiella pusilla TaxID=64973 RepID=UPI003AA7DF76
MAVFKNKIIQTISICMLVSGISFVSLTEGASVQPKFQEAVQAKDCETVVALFSDLVAENDRYYGTLSNFYEKGICLPQNYKKAFEAYLKTPEDYTGLRDIKLGQFHANGWGVPKNTQKAKELFQHGVEKELLRHEKFSDIRFGLDLILGTKDFPKQLEEIISHYEKVNWTTDQKYEFAVRFINREKSEETIKQAYYYLMRLEGKYKHAPSAYLIAKWLEKNEGFEASKSYLYTAARLGNVNAQADIGRSYFFNKSKAFKQRIAYEMLYRAYLAGEVSGEEIRRVEKKLNKFEIQIGREEAAKPLPLK